MTVQLNKLVLNLPDRTDRRAAMEKQLRRIGWNAKFEHAQQRVSAEGFPSRGAHGCYLSHLFALRRARDVGGHVVIMEDDLDFVPGFLPVWKRTFAELEKQDWSIFYPAHTLEDQPDGLRLVDPSKGIVCAHFVVFHKDAIARVVAGLEAIMARAPGDPLGGPMHVDGAYSTIRSQNPDLKTYAFSPSLGKQRRSRSDIADLKFFDRSPLLRPVMTQLRRAEQGIIYALRRRS